MSVPATSKLSYAWRICARRDVHYSHAFEHESDNVSTAEWLEATPVRGQKDLYDITQHSVVGRFSRFRRHTTFSPFEGGPFSLAQSLNKINDWEHAMLEDKIFRPVHKHYFDRFHVTTIRTTHDRDVSYSKINKDIYLKAGMIEFQKLLEKPASKP